MKKKDKESSEKSFNITQIGVLIKARIKLIFSMFIVSISLIENNNFIQVNKITKSERYLEYEKTQGIPVIKLNRYSEYISGALGEKISIENLGGNILYYNSSYYNAIRVDIYERGIKRQKYFPLNGYFNHSISGETLEYALEKLDEWDQMFTGEIEPGYLEYINTTPGMNEVEIDKLKLVIQEYNENHEDMNLQIFFEVLVKIEYYDSNKESFTEYFHSSGSSGELLLTRNTELIEIFTDESTRKINLYTVDLGAILNAL